MRLILFLLRCVTRPTGARAAITDRDFTVATIASSSSQMAADAAADTAAAEAQSGAAATPA